MAFDSTIPLLLSLLIGPGHMDHVALEEPLRLTDPTRFAKAGEAYFDPDGRRIIFQAIEHPADGSEPEEIYAMFLGTLAFDEAGAVIGLDRITQLSPPRSANTCGWFHPDNDDIVLFATTMSPPRPGKVPGYQRDTGRYRWMFPPGMDIVAARLAEDGTVISFNPLTSDSNHYIAEGSWSGDGRHLLYCSLESGDGDIYCKDLVSGESHLLVGAAGYDGGPFFSPDGRRVTYRSDRRGDHLLQVFVADLVFNEQGTIVGTDNEVQLTDNSHVNWCPFWHPSGTYLVYATSELGHENYEIFAVSVGEETPRRRRITQSPGFDGLPAFDAAGRWMMWTSKRDGTSQLWIAPLTAREHP